MQPSGIWEEPTVLHLLWDKSILKNQHYENFYVIEAVVAAVFFFYCNQYLGPHPLFKSLLLNFLLVMNG